ncbi:arylsulfatase [Halosimplex carlsbadense 2-9-1]|uniref:Arylsulfatase n=1 Tax=Halosimplex carlsbadense 2-9-1 TaxID=797114 RepID=M0D6J3_9EURY|nr:sulfatase-like hydrolase/transferase [Halosimplex carlsbadense]ELZ30317.1 arylsulfatase [Halosimplex carlsbadense 2-9-1]
MTATDTDARNLVFVTVDSLRADHCGFVDSGSSLTPAIDRIADDGVSFTQAVATGPRTPSSIPVLFTGEFMADDPEWSMADWRGRQQRIGRHMARFGHLSERLQAMGYETAGITANPWTTRESNFDAGFDRFFEISADSDDISSTQLSDSTLFKLADTGLDALPGDPLGWSDKKEWFSQWPGSFELVTEQLSALSEPFFLWVFILDSHQPYITPRRFREEASAWQMYYSILRYWHGESSDEEIPGHARDMIGAAYRDAVRSVDAFVDELADAVAPHDPVTVFCADHGEAVGDHGNFGHPQALYDENLRVPMFVHNAGVRGQVDEQVSLRSLPDMLTDLAEPTGFDPTAYTDRAVLSKTENDRHRAVRTRSWKLVRDREAATERLYDLQEDPGEREDLSSSHGEIAESLSAVLDRHDRTRDEKASIRRVTEELAAEDATV